ncbi:MAG: DUF5684 domain-containing protein [Egibacteraceae bacterium]
MEQPNGVSPVFTLIYLAAAVLILAGYWKIFVKTGRPGWGALIPLYNAYVLLQIIGRSGWWLVLFLIPIVNIVIGIIVSIDLARSFGKGAGVGLGLAFLPFIFVPILGFGDAQYVGPAAT